MKVKHIQNDVIHYFLGHSLKDPKSKDASPVQRKFLFVILVRKLSLVVVLIYKMLLLDLSLRGVQMKMEKSMR